MLQPRMMAKILGLTAFLVSGVAVFVLSPLSAIANLTIWALIGGAVGIYVFGVYRTIKKRLTEDWQWQLDPVDQWISDKDFDHIRYVISGENDEVLLVCRRHWMFLVKRVATTALVGVGLFALSIAYPAQLPMEWVLLIEIVIAAVVWFLSLDWRFSYYVVTNHYLILCRIPPVLLPFMRAPIDPLPLERISLVGNKDNPIGNLIGYGVVTVATNMQANEDAAFNTIEYVPDHEEFVRVLRAAIPSHVRDN